MLSKLVVYHANCPDGFASAFTFWTKYQDNDIEYYEGVYGGKPPLELAKDKNVFVLDFSYQLEDMQDLQLASSSLVVLDHHETAERILKELQPRPQDYIHFDMKHSGAVLAYNYLFNESGQEDNIPFLYRFIEDRDLWRKQYPETDFIYKAVLSYPFDFGIWNSILDPLGDNISTLVKEGKAIDRYYQQAINNYVLPHAAMMYFAIEKRGETESDWKWEHVPIVNCNYCFSSDVLNTLAEGHPFAASYYRAKDGTHIFSIRSSKNGVAVNKIAEIYGGGGHVHAAGFRVRQLTDAVRYMVV